MNARTEYVIWISEGMLISAIQSVASAVSLDTDTRVWLAYTGPRLRVSTYTGPLLVFVEFFKPGVTGWYSLLMVRVSDSLEGLSISSGYV